MLVYCGYISKDPCPEERSLGWINKNKLGLIPTTSPFKIYAEQEFLLGTNIKLVELLMKNRIDIL